MTRWLTLPLAVGEGGDGMFNLDRVSAVLPSPDDPAQTEMVLSGGATVLIDLSADTVQNMVWTMVNDPPTVPEARG